MVVVHTIGFSAVPEVCIRVKYGDYLHQVNDIAVSRNLLQYCEYALRL